MNLRAKARVRSLLVVLGALAVCAKRVDAADQTRMKVCHIPPGDSANFHTIIIGESALAAHLGHGDLTGSCFENCERLCNDMNACTIDACDPVTERCLSSHPPVNCDDSNPCTADSCDAADGCIYTPVVCTDDDPSTEDACIPSCGCVNRRSESGSVTAFFDDFNRADSDTVGNGWMEAALRPSDARILDGRLDFPSDDGAIVYRPYEGGGGGSDITMTWVYRKGSEAAHLNEDDGVCAGYDPGSGPTGGRSVSGCLAVMIEPVLGHRISILDGGINFIASANFPMALDTDYNFQWDIHADHRMSVWAWRAGDPRPDCPQLVVPAFTPSVRQPYWALGNRSGAHIDDFRVLTPAP